MLDEDILKIEGIQTISKNCGNKNGYKLCEIEAKKEGMIIAEFDLDNKSPQLQTTINPDEEKMPVRNIRMIEL